MPQLSEMTKEKRADRREAKKNPPCPHNWEWDGMLGLHVCTLCPLVTDERSTWERK